jgi:hypothetical protein
MAESPTTTHAKCSATSCPDSAADADRVTTLRLHLLAAEAERQGLMSEGQLARLLRLDRTELREILNTDELERGEGDGGIHGPE